MRKRQLVKITWQDIITELSVDELGDTIEAVNVGRVEYQDRKTVKLASGWYTDKKNWPSVDGTTIPKGCITSVEVLL